MRQIESILVYFVIVLLLIYIFQGYDLELYLLIVLVITTYTFRFLNYRKIKKYIKISEYLTIPMRKGNVLYELFGIVIFFSLIGFFCYLENINIIKLHSFKGLDKFFFAFAFPILSLVTYITFSDLSDKYFVTNNGIISGFRFSDFTKWEKIDSFEVDSKKSIIKLLKGNKALLKMKIERKFFNENIDKISEELKRKINVD